LACSLVASPVNRRILYSLPVQASPPCMQQLLFISGVFIINIMIIVVVIIIIIIINIDNNNNNNNNDNNDNK